MTLASAPTPRQEFIAGLRDTLPLVVGAFPFGLIFGALAVTNDIPPVHALAMSLFVFAGSSQFIATTLMIGGALPVFIVLTTLVVNLRHALYSLTLSPYIKHLGQKWLIPLSFWLTDESFVVVARHYEQEGDSRQRHWYYLASCLFMYSNWFFWTAVGVLAGSSIPDAGSWGLDFAMSVTFIGMVVPALKNRPMVLAALSAAIIAVLLNGLDNKLGLMIATLCGVAVGMWAQSRQHPPSTLLATEAKPAHSEVRA